MPRADPSVLDYDVAAEPDVTEDLERINWPDSDIHEIEYDSPVGDRVTGPIAHPPGESDAAVLFIYGMPDSARQYAAPLAWFHHPRGSSWVG